MASIHAEEPERKSGEGHFVLNVYVAYDRKRLKCFGDCQR